MSRSIHTTYARNIRGVTKTELLDQASDPNSDLSSLAKKHSIKKKVKKQRRQDKSNDVQGSDFG